MLLSFEPGAYTWTKKISAYLTGREFRLEVYLDEEDKYFSFLVKECEDTFFLRLESFKKIEKGKEITYKSGAKEVIKDKEFFPKIGSRLLVVSKTENKYLRVEEAEIKDEEFLDIIKKVFEILDKEIFVKIEKGE